MQDVGPSTLANREYRIRRFILPYWGKRQLNSLTGEEIAVWEHKLPATEGVSRSTAKDARSLLHTILGDAATARPPLIPFNPAVRPRNRGRRTGRRLDRSPQRAWATPLEVLLAAERAALLAGRDDEFTMLVTIGYTGMRWLADRGWQETGGVTAHGTTSVFAGFRFPPEVISVAVRWYLRYGLSYRDVEELLAERGITVDHVTIHRWVQRFTPEFIEAARPCRHVPGDRWFVDETYLKVAGQWTYIYRAVDQHGQVIDVLLSARRDLAAARRFFARALRAGTVPVEVTTDRASVYPRVLDELVPSPLHTFEQYANNPVEADHGRLKARVRPMRGLKRHHSARILAAGHAFVQNLRRGHYDIATEVPSHYRLHVAFDDLALTI